jgi:hypothetical protein
MGLFGFKSALAAGEIAGEMLYPFQESGCARRSGTGRGVSQLLDPGLDTLLILGLGNGHILVPFQLFAPRKAPCTSFVDRFSQQVGTALAVGDRPGGDGRARPRPLERTSQAPRHSATRPLPGIRAFSEPRRRYQDRGELSLALLASIPALSHRASRASRSAASSHAR